MTTVDPQQVLIDGLFTPQARLGWESVFPGRPVPSPEAGGPPPMRAVAPPNLRNIEDARLAARESLWSHIAIVSVIGLTGLSFLLKGGIVLVAVACFLAYRWFWPILTAGEKMRTLERRYHADLAVVEQDNQRHVDAWKGRVAAHDAAEQARLDGVDLWFPVPLDQSAARLDVFGGTDVGWASLIATAGASWLGAGSKVLIADFTGNDVGGGLASLADAFGFAVGRYDVPADLAEVRLLDELAPEDVAEVLAGAINEGRDAQDRQEREALDVELFETVVQTLASPVTFTRIRDGLSVLRRTYDNRTCDTLSVEEEAALADQVDAVVSDDAAQRELRFAISGIDALARSEASADGPAAAGSVDRFPLTILQTADRSDRRKQLVDRFLFHTLLHHLRAGGSGLHAEVLVVAGADAVGLQALESLSRHARRANVRVMFLVERLRGEVVEFIGDGSSTVVVMRLAGATEAERAAQFIGKEYTFPISQITESVSDTFTAGTSTSTGTSEGRTSTDSVNSGMSRGHGGRTSSSGSSQSIANSWTTTRQFSENTSRATGTSSGTVSQRVHEFIVAQETIQRLPATAFILVNGADEGGRTLLGDCNPGILTLDRVARLPGDASARAAQRAM